MQRLRALGIEVAALGVTPTQQMWDVEDYVVKVETERQRQDARGAIDVQGNVRMLRVQTQPRQLILAPGCCYATMNQPLAALVSAALEPDSQNSFAAKRLLAIEDGQLRRVVRPPPAALQNRPLR